jgi:multiple sugar transport system substrate-binding protein
MTMSPMRLVRGTCQPSAGPGRARRRITVALAMAATLVAAACSSGGGNQSAGAKPLTLLLPSGTVATSMQPILDAYSKQSGTKVNAIVLPVNDLRSRQVLSLNNHSKELDLVMLDDSWVAEVRNHLVPLNGLVQAADTEGFLPSVVNAFVQDGKQYALPSYMSTRTIFYRTDLLKAAGLKPPTTYAELVSDAKVLTKGSTFGFAAPLANTETLVNTWANLAYNAGLTGILDSSNKKAAFNSAGGLAALELLQQLFQNKTMPPDAVQYGMEQTATALEQGHAAMGVLTTPFMATLSDKKNTPFAGKFQITALPQGNGQTTDAYVTTGWGFAISKYCSDQKASLALLRYINDKFRNPAADASAAILTNPASNAAFDVPGIKTAFPGGSDKLVKHMVSVAVTRPHVVQWGKISTELANEMQAVFLGHQSAQEALSKAEKQVNSILSGS